MSLSLQPEHLKRYRDVARLLVRYGRSDLLSQAGIDEELETVADVRPDDEVAEEAAAFAADLEAMGPTFVKLGQLLSTRADLLPGPYLAALARLQDRCEPFPYEEVHAIVEAELGARISKLFSSFDRKPLAAASLGQVHRAALRDGRVVAVKVQRPDIRDRIGEDLAALAEIAGFLDRRTEAGRRFGFGPMLDQFRRAMVDELDYRREAQNLATLGENLAEFDRILVPAPVPDYTTARVLTMEFVGGRKITSLGPLARMELDGRELAEQLFRAYLQQVLQDGFFHADPHPGNVFLTDDDRLALIDLGMVARIGPDLQDQLVKLLLAISEGRGADAADVVIDMGERREVFDEAELVRRITDLVARNHGVALEQLSAGSIVAELSRIAGECGLRPPPELTMLGKALLNLDQVAQTLDPSFDPAAAMREEAAGILRSRMLRAATPGNVLAAAMEAKEFAERLPGRVNKVMDALAEGELRLNIQGIDERELMRTMQKVANRITTGLVLAALIVGAAMLMRVDTDTQLFGYPALAIVCFLVAATGGLLLVLSIVIGDRRR